MKLIIDIDDEEYNRFKEAEIKGYVSRQIPISTILNGIPLKDEVMLATLLSLVADKDYKPKLEGEQE